jgi:hypothetical protein
MQAEQSGKHRDQKKFGQPHPHAHIIPESNILSKSRCLKCGACVRGGCAIAKTSSLVAFAQPMEETRRSLMAVNRPCNRVAKDKLTLSFGPLLCDENMLFYRLGRVDRGMAQVVEFKIDAKVEPAEDWRRNTDKNRSKMNGLSLCE